jgi:uncharacterized membrane protein YgdD (TMEM256/DUF423 family)
VSTFVLSLGSRQEFATIGRMNHRAALAWAGILGATGVAAGAIGAHGLRGVLEAAGARESWETAVRFQLVHAAALLGFAGWLRASSKPGGRCEGWAVRLWVAGTALFSGSIYVLALGGPRWLWPATPLGGVALIAGWILAAVAAFAA